MLNNSFIQFPGLLTIQCLNGGRRPGLCITLNDVNIYLGKQRVREGHATASTYAMEPGGRRNSEGTCLHKVSAAVSAPTKSYLHQVRCAHCSGIYARQINEEVVYMALFATSSTHQLASEFKTSEYSAFRFSLVPRHRGGGEERAPGIHCLRMRLIPWRPCSYVYVCIC